MTSTPKSIGEESLAESWVDVSMGSGRVTPVTVSAINGSPINGPIHGQLSAQIGEEYLRLLKEAQRESNYSSSRVSLASSRRDSRCESPKSPPNSPNNEIANGDEEMKGIFINKDADPGKEWMMSYWTARCDSGNNKNGTIRSKAKLSFRNAKCGDKGIFSRDIMFALFLSNIVSLILGAGIGLWMSKKPSNVISHFPLN